MNTILALISIEYIRPHKGEAELSADGGPEVERMFVRIFLSIL